MKRYDRKLNYLWILLAILQPLIWTFVQLIFMMNVTIDSRIIMVVFVKFFMLLNNSSFSLQLVTATPMLLKFVINRWPLLIPTTVFCMTSLLSMHKGWLLHSHLNWANVILYALGKFTTGMEPWSASTDLNPIKVDLGLSTGLIK